MLNEQAFEAKINWFDKIKWKLFPWPNKPLDDNEKRTYLTTEVHCHLDWKDRIRTLITGHVIVRTTTYTDIEVKDAKSISTVGVIC